MLTVTFCKNGHHVADANVLAYVDSVFWEYDFGGRADIEVNVGNELIVDAFVLRVMEGKFPKSEIQFFDGQTKLVIDECCGLVPQDNTKDLTFGMQEKLTREILNIANQNRIRSQNGKDAQL